MCVGGQRQRGPVRGLGRGRERKRGRGRRERKQAGKGRSAAHVHRDLTADQGTACLLGMHMRSGPLRSATSPRGRPVCLNASTLESMLRAEVGMGKGKVNTLLSNSEK